MIFRATSICLAITSQPKCPSCLFHQWLWHEGHLEDYTCMSQKDGKHFPTGHVHRTFCRDYPSAELPSASHQAGSQCHDWRILMRMGMSRWLRDPGTCWEYWVKRVFTTLHGWLILYKTTKQPPGMYKTMCIKGWQNYLRHVVQDFFHQ